MILPSPLLHSLLNRASIAMPKLDLTLAMIAEWGERCDVYEPGCPVCEAWRVFDRINRVPAADEVPCGLDASGNVIPARLRPGVRVVWDSQSNLGFCDDVVREVFWQKTGCADVGYDEGLALVLTHYSWVWARDVTVIPEDGKHCPECGALMPPDQSCGCFDNGSE